VKSSCSDVEKEISEKAHQKALEIANYISAFEEDMSVEQIQDIVEEKLMAEEGLKKTENELIHVGCPIPFDVDEFLRQLPLLMQAAYGNCSNIRMLVMSIVSTYHPAQEEIQKSENDISFNHVDNENSLRKDKLRV